MIEKTVRIALIPGLALTDTMHVAHARLLARPVQALVRGACHTNWGLALIQDLNITCKVTVRHSRTPPRDGSICTKC